jgi:hypothetical protein
VHGGLDLSANLPCPPGLRAVTVAGLEQIHAVHGREVAECDGVMDQRDHVSMVRADIRLLRDPRQSSGWPRGSDLRGLSTCWAAR